MSLLPGVVAVVVVPPAVEHSELIGEDEVVSWLVAEDCCVGGDSCVTADDSWLSAEGWRDVCHG